MLPISFPSRDNRGAEMIETATALARDRYVFLPSMIRDPLLGELFRYACRMTESGLMSMNDDQVRGTPAAYCDFMMDHLLMTLLPKVEEASGFSLFPTYSYLRIYKHGDILARHTDRPSCEISITVCLGTEPEDPWPIWIQGPHGTSAAKLKPGDALLYRGIECPHWREAFEGRHLAQVFLHYVDQAGPHAEWKFDKRQSLRRVDSLVRS